MPTSYLLFLTHATSGVTAPGAVLGYKAKGLGNLGEPGAKKAPGAPRSRELFPAGRRGRRGVRNGGVCECVCVLVHTQCQENGTAVRRQRERDLAPATSLDDGARDHEARSPPAALNFSPG